MDETLQVANALVQNAPQSIEYINQINEFYNSAWDKLIIGGGMLLTVIGIIIPAILQYWQLKTLKHSEKFLLDEINNKIKESKEELEILIHKKIQEENEINKKEFDIILEVTEGKLLHMQGNFFLNANPEEALCSYIRASKKYINTGSAALLLKMLSGINAAIEGMTKAQLLKREDLDNINIGVFLKEVQESCFTELCDVSVRKIKENLQKINY